MWSKAFKSFVTHLARHERFCIRCKYRACTVPTQHTGAGRVLRLRLSLIKNGAVPAVPNIWVVELAAVLARSKKAGRISKATLDKACGYYDQLSVDVHYIEYTTKKLVQLSAIYNLAGYDAVYFDLAKFLNIPIASVDKGHCSACKAHGVELL